MSSLHRKRRILARRISNTQRIWVVLISSSFIYFYIVIQFATRLDSGNQPSQHRGRLNTSFIFSSPLDPDTILDLPNSLQRKDRSTDGDDDDGSGKHRPYPFKVSSHCPNNDIVNGIDRIRQNRTNPNDRIVSIRGERHTGTKLIRVLLNRNMMDIQHLNDKLVEVNMTMDTVYGWKHGFFPNHFQIHPRDVFLIVVKDPFSWAFSMFRDPYNMIFHDNTTHFGPFLTGSYTAQNCEAPHFMKKCVFPMEEAENIIQLRTAKYKNWTNYPHIPHSLVRYEDIAQDQIRILDFLDKHGIPHDDPRYFQRADSYIGFRGESKKSYTPTIQREQYLGHYTIDEIRFVMRNLDLDFEKNVLNYTYDDVDAYINDRLEGRKVYLGAPTLLDANIRARISKSESFRLGILNLNQYDC